MQTYTTKDGKVVSLNLDHGKLEEIKARIGWDPMEVGGGDFKEFQAVTNDPKRLLPMLHIAVGGTFEEFFNSTRGEALDRCINAFVLEIGDFFPQSVRCRIVAVWEKLNQMSIDAVPKQVSLLSRKVEPLLEQAMEQAMDRALVEQQGYGAQPTSGQPSGGQPGS